jgi:hypothetical protein
MANIKKSRRERKRQMSISVKQGTYEDYQDLCKLKGLVVSHDVEAMIVNRIKQLTYGRTRESNNKR